MASSNMVTILIVLLILAVAAVFFIGLAVGIFFLVRYLNKKKQNQPPQA